MTPATADQFIPLELVFNPNWWHKTTGISFEREFYFDKATRIKNDITMRRVLHERYGELGMGEPDPQPRPIIGSQHVAGGFVIPALLGAEILFEPDAAPQPQPIQMNLEDITSMEKPDFRNLWPMNELIQQMDELEAEYGYVIGDLNTDGLLNAAYHFYGQQLYIDFYMAPDRVRYALELVGELIADVAEYVRRRTGTTSIAVNRMVSRVMPSMFLHGNCSVHMISPQSYRDMQLPVELKMAERLKPFGVHHCGDNLHHIAPIYAELPSVFFDVGWGSDPATCREALPDAFLNLRLNPVRMLQCSAKEIAADTEGLLASAASAGTLDNVGVCCINMDYGTPDENIIAMFEVVQKYRKAGA